MEGHPRLGRGVGVRKIHSVREQEGTLPLQGTLGIDFGTSNSAMAWAEPGGTAHLITLEGEATAMPTAVFYNSVVLLVSAVRNEKSYRGAGSSRNDCTARNSCIRFFSSIRKWVPSPISI